MRTIAGVIFLLFSLAMILLGLGQFFAIAMFFENWFGGYMFLSALFALIVSPIPVLSTVLGVCGAVVGWGFSIFWAIVLFFPLLLVYIPMLFGISISVIYLSIKTWINNRF